MDRISNVREHLTVQTKGEGNLPRATIGTVKQIDGDSPTPRMTIEQKLKPVLTWWASAFDWCEKVLTLA